MNKNQQMILSTSNDASIVCITVDKQRCPDTNRICQRLIFNSIYDAMPSVPFLKTCTIVVV